MWSSPTPPRAVAVLVERAGTPDVKVVQVVEKVAQGAANPVLVAVKAVLLAERVEPLSLRVRRAAKRRLGPSDRRGIPSSAEIRLRHRVIVQRAHRAATDQLEVLVPRGQSVRVGPSRLR